MPRLILILAIALVVYILLQRVRGLPPHKRRAEYIKLGLGVAVIIVIGLTISGKMHWLGAALTGLLVILRQLGPTLLRLFPMLASRYGQGASAGAGQSAVQTAILRMQLNHENGELAGEVLDGHYSGWRLADMDEQQLRELLTYCQQQDAESAQLLDSYLEQRFGEAYTTSRGQQNNAAPSGEMSRKEALAVLGLDDSAGRDDIVDAHRKLMQKMHPDRGGSDYLAAKINQAKDILLG